MPALISRPNVSSFLDMTYGGWIRARKEVAGTMNMPYVRIDTSNHLLIEAADTFLKSEDAKDAAIIFETKTQLVQSIYYIIGNSFLRIVGASMDEEQSPLIRL